MESELETRQRLARGKRRVGRPPKNLNVTEQKRDRKERMDIAVETPKKRVGLTRKGLLGFPHSVEKEEGMHYCWALDDDKNNLQRYLDAEYRPALNQAQKKEMRPSGSGHMLVLMKIEEKWYQEDYAEEQARIVGRGSKDQQLGAGEYLPMGVQKVLSKNAH